MATYDLNEELKRRKQQQAAEAQGTENAGQEQELALDDVSRVKVLSPGRQVFKRFIRNRLAVFGSVLLITMFVFSFIGPLFYGYGQKQIFYKYDVQNVNYALAKLNETYNGYDVDSSINVERKVGNVMNSTIKSMLADGVTDRIILGEEGSYEVEELREDVYLLSEVDMKKVATAGNGTADIGVYDSISKKLNYKVAPIEGLEEAAAAACKGQGGTFDHEGVTYTYKKAQGKSYSLTAEFSGILYDGRELGEEFETALNKAIESGEDFSVGGKDYTLSVQKGSVDVYERGDATPAKIYTRLTVDTFEAGQQVSSEFRVNALMATLGDGSFSADGKDYTIADEDGVLTVRDASGEEYAEFTLFAVRRYSGADTMEYDLKKAIADKIREMQAQDAKSGTLTHKLPLQNDNGEYTYDENGELMYQDTEMLISQRDTGEYVINADQVNYIIDMYATPSWKHILGTDGDGFDVMARIMYGGRISLMVGFVVVFLELLLGVIMGGLAGYYGGWVDMLIMRLVDIFYCLPSMPIMIILGAMMDAQRMNTYVRLFIMMAALGIMGWAGVARLVRGQILSLREQEFMVATEATGLKVRDRIFHHLVPNVMPQLIVTATMGVGGVILTESTLSFLGLGVKHPLATWGTIINSVSSASAMAHYAFIWIPVGLLICVTVIAFNFVGDGLRDAYDPRAKR